MYVDGITQLFLWKLFIFDLKKNPGECNVVLLGFFQFVLWWVAIDQTIYVVL